MTFNRVVESILNEDRSDRLEQTLNTVLDVIQERFPDLYKEILSVQSPDELKTLLKSSNQDPIKESWSDIVDNIKSALSMPAVIGMLSSALGLNTGAIALGASAGVDSMGAGLGATLGATAVTSALGLFYSIIQGRKKGFDEPLYKFKSKNPQAVKHVERMEAIEGRAFGNVEAAEYFYEKVPSALWKDVLRMFKSRNPNSIVPTYIDSKIGAKNR